MVPLEQLVQLVQKPIESFEVGFAVVEGFVVEEGFACDEIAEGLRDVEGFAVVGFAVVGFAAEMGLGLADFVLNSVGFGNVERRLGLGEEMNKLPDNYHIGYCAPDGIGPHWPAEVCGSVAFLLLLLPQTKMTLLHLRLHLRLHPRAQQKNLFFWGEVPT